MIPDQLKSLNLGARLAVGGAVGILLGFILFIMRLPIAATFLGADFFLGMPITRADASKIYLVSGHSLLILAGGLQLLISGAVVSFVQAKKERKTAAGTDPIPVNQ